MSYSSSTRSLMSETLSWVFLALLCAGTIIYFEELKGLMHTAMGTEGVRAVAPSARSEAGPQDTSPVNHSGYMVELKAGLDGHYHSTAEINGRDVQVLVDTGATMVALTYEDAESAGIFVSESDFTHSAATANGTSRVAPVTLDSITIGDITVRNVRGMVTEPDALSVTLLGMTFLSQLERVDMRNGTLILEE